MPSRLSIQCLQLAATGYETTEIAEHLGFEIDLIEQAFVDGRAALDAKDNAHAVAIALRRKLIR